MSLYTIRQMYAFLVSCKIREIMNER